MPPRPTNRSIAAAAIAASSQEPPVMPPPVAAAQAAAIEPAEAQTQPTTNAVALPPASLLPALSPAHASDDVIDYSTSDGMKLYSASIATLPIKDFEGTGGNVQTWINDLIERAQAMNWIAILTVVINGISYFIPRCFTLTIQQVQDHARSYLFAPQGRPKQNSAVLYRCLYASIGPKLRTKVSNCRSDYMINILGQEFADGPCFLRAILQHLYIDTPSTAYFKRSQLSDMPTIMKLAEGNINNFNERVRTLVNELASVGQSVNNEDLLINLMKGYEAAPDKPFVRQMQDKHTRIMYYNDADREMEHIMRFAEQFWTDRTNSGTWGKPTHEEQQLIALTAQIRNFKAGGPSSKMEKLSTSNKPTTKNGEKTKKAKSKSNFDPYTPDQAWKWIAPKSDEAKNKTHKGRTYYWCTNHQHKETKKKGMWVTHQPSKCHSKLVIANSSETETANTTTTSVMASIINAYEEAEE
jgi:hypothetical protein